MKNGFVQYWRSAVNGQKTGFFARLLLTTLKLPGGLYRYITGIRNTCYDTGVFSVYHGNVPVISVGNIVVGGTGKTPVIQLVANELSPYKRAILSRGYKSKAFKDKSPIVLNNDDNVHYNINEVGDEPYMLSKILPEVSVFVGRDRVASAIDASKNGCKVIMLDDGFQHRKLFRDFDILVVDGKEPLGGSNCLPRGFLRESLNGFDRADIVVINHVDTFDEYCHVKKIISCYTDAPVIGGSPVVGALKPLYGECQELKGKKIAAFCGIAKPERFVKLLEGVGAEVCLTMFVGDHQAFKYDDLKAFAVKAKLKDCDAMVCTEKDWGHLPEQLPIELPVSSLGMKFKVKYDISVWSKFISNVKQVIEDYDRTTF